IAEAAQHLGTVQSRQHPVEHDRVVGLGAGQVQAVGAVRRGVERVAAGLEVLEDVGDQVAVVFDDEQAHAELPVWRGSIAAAPPERLGSRPRFACSAGTATPYRDDAPFPPSTRPPMPTAPTLVHRPRWGRSLAWLLLLAALVFGAALGQRAPAPADEPRFVLA